MSDLIAPSHWFSSASGRIQKITFYLFAYFIVEISVYITFPGRWSPPTEGWQMESWVALGGFEQENLMANCHDLMQMAVVGHSVRGSQILFGLETTEWSVLIRWEQLVELSGETVAVKTHRAGGNRQNCWIEHYVQIWLTVGQPFYGLILTDLNSHYRFVTHQCLGISMSISLREYSPFLVLFKYCVAYIPISVVPFHIRPS